MPKRSNALTDKELACLFEYEIAENPHLKKLCRLVGKSSLIVFESDEKKFREFVRIIGYGVKIK